MLAVMIPTVLMTAAGIVLLAVGSRSVSIVAGVLVLAFCTTSVTGYILGSIFVSRGASLARVQNDYVSSVSHELRTPLTSIRMFIETLRREDALDPEQKEQVLSLLNRELERLEGLVAKMVDLSRWETGRKGLDRSPVAVADVVDDALASFEAATLAEPITPVVELEPGLVVRGDRAALSLVLTNLLSNAWKYTPAEGRQISVHARAAGRKYVEITVSDNGPGIARGEQRLVFERFTRGTSAETSGAAGTGLGLSIVRAIVRGHKGRVEVHSRPGHGAEFRITLRRHETTG